MIKMIAIDLDGTLYTTDRRVTISVREALARAISKGLQLAIITGRGIRGVEIALETIGYNLPFVCSAGAFICYGLNGPIIHSRSFHNHTELMEVIRFSRENGIGLISEPINSQPYWFGPDSMKEIMDPLTAKEANSSIRTFQPEVDFNLPMLKVTITAQRELLTKAEQILKTKCPSLNYVYSGIQYLDITAKGVNKGTALETLSNYLGYLPAEIAAIGDQAIDYQMLKFAGLPIAMANSVTDLFEIAKWVAPTNDENGVAWAINEILRQSE